MGLSFPSLKGTPMVNSVQRPQGSRPLKLFAVFYPAIAALRACLHEQTIESAHGKYNVRQQRAKTHGPSLPSAITPTLPQTETIFVDALVQATMCRKHARPRENLQLKSCIDYTHHKTRRRNDLVTPKQIRRLHQISTIRPAITRAPPSREEYLSLVDTYKDYSTQAQWMEPTPPPQFPILLSSSSIDSGSNLSEAHISREWDTPYKESDLSSIVGNLTLDQASDRPPKPSQTQVTYATSVKDVQGGQQRPDVSNLLRILKNTGCDHEEAYKAYSELPAPGISLLSETQIRLLFRRLSNTKRKDPQMALHYLSVVDEMRSLNLPMIQGEWNSAIAFCGQCFARIGAREVEDALLMWKEMENEANVESNNVTFNILFDMAAKAGKFVLADMILKEMDTRGLEYNRFFRVGNIYFHGLRGDGDGVRRAYGELVKAGEIVDTVVMNCVIAALISAGELASAENVYDRMKRLISDHAGSLLPKPLTWQENRNLGRVLDRLARSNGQATSSSKGDKARLRLARKQVSILPDIHTFSIFIEHHASQTGDLHQISAILAEMQFLGVPINSRIFLKLFKGFSKHGQQPLTAWTPDRLKSVWTSLLAVLDDGSEDVKIGKWMAIWIVRAFHHCAGREWALHIWEDIRARGKPDQKDVESVHVILRDILK